MLDLEPAAREVVRLLKGITHDRLADPTPCADRSVAALLDHLMGLSLAFTWAAHKTTTTEGGANPGPGEASAEHLDPGWRTILPRRLFELVEAWRDPKAWQGVTEAGGVRMPAEQMSVVALDELVLHGWDLARATGQFLPVIPPAWTLSSRSPGRPAQPEPRPAAKVCSARWSMFPRMRQRSIGRSALPAVTLGGRRCRPSRRWSARVAHGAVGGRNDRLLPLWCGRRSGDASPGGHPGVCAAVCCLMASRLLAMVVRNCLLNSGSRNRIGPPGLSVDRQTKPGPTSGTGSSTARW